MDYKYAYQYNCGDETTGLVAQAVTQCADNWWVEFWMCGVAITNSGGDFSTTTIDWKGFLSFPRKLATGVSCFFPADCMDKCQLLRDQGTPSEYCTMCYTPCPVNIISTISTLVTAIYHDFYEALKLTVQCFVDGVVSCVCATALMLEPAWLKPSDHRYTDAEKCYTGDPLRLISGAVGEIALEAINNFGKSIGSAFDDIFGGGGNALESGNHLRTINNDIRGRCQVEYGVFGSAQKCYYARVQEICHSDESYAEFAELHGDAFEKLANTPAEVAKATGDVQITPYDLFQDPVALCYAKANLNLGQVIEACVIRMIAGNQRTGKGGLHRPASAAPATGRLQRRAHQGV